MAPSSTAWDANRVELSTKLSLQPAFSPVSPPPPNNGGRDFFFLAEDNCENVLRGMGGVRRFVGRGCRGVITGLCAAVGRAGRRDD